MLDLKLKAFAYTALTIGIFVLLFSLMVRFTLAFLVGCVVIILSMLVYALYMSFFFYLSDNLSKDSTENVVESENDSLQASE